MTGGPGLQCCELASKLGGDLAKEGLQGKNLTLKLKHPTFEVSYHRPPPCNGPSE